MTQQQKDQLTEQAFGIYCDRYSPLLDRFEKLADLVWSLTHSLPVEESTNDPQT